MGMDFDDLIRILLLLGVVVWYAVLAIMRSRNKESNVHNKPKEATLIETVNKDFKKKAHQATSSSISEDTFDRQLREVFFPITKKEKPKDVIKTKPASPNKDKAKKHRIKKYKITEPKSPPLKKPLLTKETPLPILDRYSNPFVKGIIWSEVYGKPRAFKDIR